MPRFDKLVGGPILNPWGAYIPNVPSGSWSVWPGGFAGVAATLNRMYMLPLDLTEDTLLTEIWWETTIAAGAGGVGRTGIYQDRGDGARAGELYHEIGTAATDGVAGVVTQAVNLVIPQGRTWLAWVGQVAVGTMRMARNAYIGPVSLGTKGFATPYEAQAAVTGALPTRFAPDVQVADTIGFGVTV
jgi:hypothetical protein